MIYIPIEIRKVRVLRRVDFVYTHARQVKAKRAKKNKVKAKRAKKIK